MNMTLSAAVEFIENAASWKKHVPDSEGIYHYFLEGNIDLDIQSPDNRILILSATLGSAPSEESGSFDQEIKQLGLLSTASMKKRNSVLSIHHEMLELSRTLQLSTLSETELKEQVRDFLNDQAWWKLSLSNATATETAAPDFSKAWFPPELSF